MVYATSLLKLRVSDPDTLSIGETIYFTGSTNNDGDPLGGESIDIYAVNKSDIVNHTSGVVPLVTSAPVITFNPRNYVEAKYGTRHRYCGVAGPDLSFKPDGNILLVFSAIFVPDTDDTCAVITSGSHAISLFMVTLNPADAAVISGPDFFQWGPLQSPPNYIVGWTLNHLYPALDFSVFQDGANYWGSYTWFGPAPVGSVRGGNNATSTINLTDNTIIDNTVPNYTFDEGITEAPAIFKRNNFYYLIYSENFYDSKYQLLYKKATSVQGLNLNSKSCRLSFNSWETRPDRNSAGYNAGHGSVEKIDNAYYLFYHLGYGQDTNAQDLIRDTYVDKLEFDQNGNIIQIPAPYFVDNGNPHTGNGNLYWCNQLNW